MIRYLLCFMLCVVTLTLCSCGSMQETVPPRSATEQLLLSTAVDRAMERMPDNNMSRQKVFVDADQLQAYDRSYVEQRVREQVLKGGCCLVDKEEDADIVLEVASGGLSIDTRSSLIGIPAIPIPVPFTAEPVKTPELPFYKAVSHVARCKLLLSCIDAKTRRMYAYIPILRGTATLRERWFVLLGPFRKTDLNEEFQ